MQIISKKEELITKKLSQAFSHTVGKVRKETTKQNTNKKGDQKHGKNHKQNKRV